MSASNEWSEYHLTPDGWVEGSDKTDFKGTTTKPVPENRVLTLCFHEYLSSPFSKLDCWTEVSWEHADKSRITELRARFGECPGNFNVKKYPMK